VRVKLLERLRRLPGLEEAPSQWTGGAPFWGHGREIVHFHRGEAEVRVTRRRMNVLEDERVVRRTRTSDWAIVPADEEDLIVELTRTALEANR
jgi:luciferase-like monooxygenase